jgi:site-specific DNA-cytosine methylase
MRAIDLFAGAGGFSTGAAMAGCTVVWAANHWPAAVQVHANNHPDTLHVCQDLQQADWTSVPAHDLLLASPACQGHSRARGKERPHHDAQRSTAWAVVSAAECHRPAVVLVENVPEFAQWQLYPAWAAAMQALGYSLAPTVIDAADHGVPQHRDRLITVCGPALVDWPAPTHGPGRPLPWVTSGEVLGLQVLGGGTNPHGPGAEHERTFRDLTAPPSTTIAASPAGNGGPFVIEYGGTRGDRGQGYVGTDRPAPVVGTAGDLRLALSVGGPNARGGQGPSVTGLEDPGPTVRTHADCYLVEGPEYRRIRTLTVEERARLQSLPWHPTLTGRTVGNAVPPPLAAAVVRQVLAVEARR